MLSNNRQLGLNLIASVAIYIVQYSISLVLTPYIINKLGVAAYGFVGLSTQIIGYSSLITIALNSMAGRFVSIEYYKGNIEKANKYFSSVFYSNVIISAFLFLISFVLVIYLDCLINIPRELIIDVKLLFAFLSLNSILGIIANVYSVSTFIKNRLDYANIKNIIGNIIRAIVLVSCFTLFSPKVWYFGFTTILCSIYILYTNYIFYKKATPELLIRKRYYNKKCIIDLIKSGSWNVLTKLSRIFEDGLNLLIANIFIGAKLAGTLALSVTVPTMINSVTAMMASNFAPSWTQLYASNDKTKMLTEILKSVRIMGFIASIPVAVFFVYGDMFFSLWVPTQNAMQLYWLSVAGSFVMVFAMPLETLWNIFTITNQVKKSSINLLENSLIMFAIVMIGMFVVKDNIVRLFIIASTKSIVASIRTLTFLPMQGAKCLGYPIKTFYPPVLKNLVCIFLISSMAFFIRIFFIPNSWFGLITGTIITCIIGLVYNFYISFNRCDRNYFINKIKAFI